MDSSRRNRIAQWVYDTRAILGRFHIWLEDVEERWVQGGTDGDLSFVGGSLERSFMMAAGVTALGQVRRQGVDNVHEGHRLLPAEKVVVVDHDRLLPVASWPCVGLVR